MKAAFLVFHHSPFTIQAGRRRSARHQLQALLRGRRFESWHALPCAPLILQPRTAGDPIEDFGSCR